jgi:hypothetical protein
MSLCIGRTKKIDHINGLNNDDIILNDLNNAEEIENITINKNLEWVIPVLSSQKKFVINNLNLIKKNNPNLNILINEFNINNFIYKHMNNDNTISDTEFRTKFDTEFSTKYLLMCLSIGGIVRNYYNFIFDKETNKWLDTISANAIPVVSPIIRSNNVSGFLLLEFVVSNGFVKIRNVTDVFDDYNEYELLNNRLIDLLAYVHSKFNELILSVDTWDWNMNGFSNNSSEMIEFLHNDKKLNSSMDVIKYVKSHDRKISVVMSQSINGVKKICGIKEELNKLDCVLLGESKIKSVINFGDKREFSKLMNSREDTKQLVPKTYSINGTIKLPCIIKNTDDKYAGSCGNTICRDITSLNIALNGRKKKKISFIVQELIENEKNKNNKHSIGYECEIFSIDGKIINYVGIECICDTLKYEKYGIGLECEPISYKPINFATKYLNDMENVLMLNNKYTGFSNFNFTFDNNEDIKIFEVNPRLGSYIVRHIPYAFHDFLIVASRELRKISSNIVK